MWTWCLIRNVYCPERIEEQLRGNWFLFLAKQSFVRGKDWRSRNSETWRIEKKGGSMQDLEVFMDVALWIIFSPPINTGMTHCRLFISNEMMEPQAGAKHVTGSCFLHLQTAAISQKVKSICSVACSWQHTANSCSCPQNALLVPFRNPSRGAGWQSPAHHAKGSAALLLWSPPPFFALAEGAQLPKGPWGAHAATAFLLWARYPQHPQRFLVSNRGLGLWLLECWQKRWVDLVWFLLGKEKLLLLLFFFC